MTISRSDASSAGPNDGPRARSGSRSGTTTAEARTGLPRPFRVNGEWVTFALVRVKMDERNTRDLKGQPSDYGSRGLSRTADGEPEVDRGTAESANTGDEDRRSNETSTKHEEQR